MLGLGRAGRISAALLDRHLADHKLATLDLLAHLGQLLLPLGLRSLALGLHQPPPSLAPWRFVGERFAASRANPATGGVTRTFHRTTPGLPFRALRTYRCRSMTPTTEITLTGGIRYRVQGDAGDVERVVLDAARGSIMELAWLIDAETGDRVGFNPAFVVTLRSVSP